MNTRKLTAMAMLIAVSIVLVYLIRSPIFMAAPFLEYDPADIPILIGTFIFGPVAGIILTVIASLIQGLTVSASSGLFGILMHVIATGVLVLVAGNIYKIRKNFTFLVIGIVCGVLAMAVAMTAFNLIITPIFMKVDVAVVKTMLLPVIIPFNLIKAGVNGLIAGVLYLPLSALLKKYTFLGPDHNGCRSMSNKANTTKS